MLVFASLSAIGQIWKSFPIKWLPFSFLFWGKAIRETHTLADLANGTIFGAFAAAIPSPSMDSIVSSLLAVGGCLLYVKELHRSPEDTPSRPKKVARGKKKRRHLGVAQ